MDKPGRTLKLVVLIALLAAVHTILRAQPRIDTRIDEDWRYISGDVARADDPSFDDSDWEAISLPHTWNAFDGQDGGNNYRRGVGWYRKHLVLDPHLRGKSLYLRCEGASTVASVFVNGHLAGTHRGGFGAFCFEITPLLLFDGPESIAIRVTNAPDSTVPPLRGDFTIFGGIYRSVHLLVLNDISISPLDHASPGVYLRQSNVSPQQADLEITTVLRNSSGANATLRVTCSILDHRGAVVSSAESPFTLSSATTRNCTLRVSLDSPHLWNGRTDPYLYSAVVSVFVHGTMRDQVIQPLGIRTYAVDPATGFSLNGRHYPLHGVNRHQDRENKGWAISRADHQEDYRRIEEMGCTAVRLAHYQQAEDFYELCDRGGMVVWAELSLVDGIDPSPEFDSTTREALRELVKQNLNHPSIVFWGLANELIPDAYPALYDSLVTRLNVLAHSLDPTRSTAIASRSRYDGSLFINTMADVIGYNVYKGWYEGDPEDVGPYLDSLHSRFPGQCIGITEYGAGAGISQHEVPPHKPRASGPWHPEEWQSSVHEVYLDSMQRRTFLWGTFVWNMFDFASDSRSEGERPGRNDKGLVTYDRKVRKDAFYWYKAHWNPDPMIHITSRRFTPRPAGTTSVRVYTNCDSLNLVVNNTSLGTKRVVGMVGVWDDVALREGDNLIVAVGMTGQGGELCDSCVWYGKEGRR